MQSDLQFLCSTANQKKSNFVATMQNALIISNSRKIKVFFGGHKPLA